MAKVESTEQVFSFGITGKLGQAWEYGEKINGMARYGNTEHQIDKKENGIREYGQVKYGENDTRIGIYQRRHKEKKVIYSRLKFYIPKNPQTTPQQAHRTIFINGMSEWKNLTQEQKNAYNKKAHKKHLHGVNLFLREYLKTN